MPDKYVRQERRRTAPTLTELERMRDLARYARDPHEQRYWEIYWERYNLYPAALRRIYLRPIVRKIIERGARRFDPETYRRDEEKMPGNTPGRRWLKDAWENSKIRAVDEEEQQELENTQRVRERAADSAITYLKGKFFDKYDLGAPKGHHAWDIEEVLEKTMYGADLHLANIYVLAKRLRKIAEEIARSKYEVDVSKWEKELDEIRNRLEMEGRAWGRGKADPLQIRGEEWEKKTRGPTLLAKYGPVAAWSGYIPALDAKRWEEIRKDRRIYKKRAVLNGVLAAKIEAILEHIEGNGPPHLDEIHKGITKSLNRSPGAIMELYLSDELNKLRQRKGKIEPADFETAFRRALQRTHAELKMADVSTPFLVTSMLSPAIREFFEEYKQKYGEYPIIAKDKDMVNILKEVERRAEREIRRGPHYYMKGYVLHLLNAARGGKVKKTGE